MIEWITKYKFRRKGLLITWDWGYAREAITPKEAHANGLVLFRNRWVSKDARKRLMGELRIFQLVRLLAAFVMIQSLVIFVDALLWSFFFNPMDIVVSIFLVATALGLWCFQRISWVPAIGYAVLVTGIGAYRFLATATGPSDISALASLAGLLLLFLAYVSLVWFVLLNKTTRKIFS